MEEGRMTIKLIIAQRVIELIIQKEWEEYYRKAEKVINESFFNFAKKWTYTDHQDILSKILINFVVQGIETEERLQAYEEDLIPKMEELKRLTDKINID
ncbi:MAG TPA: cell division protein ZapA [Bacteroidales bacterium]|nr:cell division protein ZapA [Bacteroidales bacterium]